MSTQRANESTSLEQNEHTLAPTLISLPEEFKKIESLDDPTLYEYLEHILTLIECTYLDLYFSFFIYFF